MASSLSGWTANFCTGWCHFLKVFGIDIERHAVFCFDSNRWPPDTPTFLLFFPNMRTTRPGHYGPFFIFRSKVSRVRQA